MPFERELQELELSIEPVHDEFLQKSVLRVWKQDVRLSGGGGQEILERPQDVHVPGLDVGQEGGPDCQQGLRRLHHLLLHPQTAQDL